MVPKLGLVKRLQHADALSLGWGSIITGVNVAIVIMMTKT